MSKFTKENPGKGRPPGAPNKLTKSVREAFEAAFIDLQNDENACLPVWGRRHPAAFYQLAARLIPAEMNLAVKGTISERLNQARKVVGK